MKNTPEGLRLAATDLSAHLGCHHVTALDLGAVHGERDAPAYRDPDVVVLQERGREHEAAYLESLRAAGLRIVDLRASGDADAVTQTLAAMRDGADVIAQAGLQCGNCRYLPVHQRGLLRAAPRPTRGSCVAARGRPPLAWPGRTLVSPGRARGEHE